ATLVPIWTRRVLAPSAASQANENGACPPVCFQGWKWSLTNTESNPTSSARQEKSSNSRGPNCSADALYPSFSKACSSNQNHHNDKEITRSRFRRPGGGRDPSPDTGRRLSSGRPKAGPVGRVRRGNR